MNTYPHQLFPAIEPYKIEFLKVSNIHTLCVEQSGNPNGKPVVFLHGGPGAGTSPYHRQYFNPEKYRIILFDQRGCGKSTPFAELRENSTWDLVADIEKIRIHLGIDRWMVFGGSWGSALALAYAETHPDHCTELLLRGIFLLRKEELFWFYQNPYGAGALFPNEWNEFEKMIPPDERSNMIAAYYKRLTSDDSSLRIPAAKAWSLWEGRTISLIPDADTISYFGGDHYAQAFARIECHYFMNDGFFETDGQLLTNAHRLKSIPTVIVHGRYDVICPAKNALDLHAALPSADLHIIPDAGHAVTEPGIRSKLIEYTNKWS